MAWVDLLKEEGKEPAEAVAQARAAQILAEMLGIVCHPEYFQADRKQLVSPRSLFLRFYTLLTLKGIVVHFDGFHASVYWAEFPSIYLNTLREGNVDQLKDFSPKIKLRHTRRYNLINTVQRTEFIKEFIALLRYVAAGDAHIGYLRNDTQDIHRTLVSGCELKDDLPQCAPQEAFNRAELNMWRERDAQDYAT